MTLELNNKLTLAHVSSMECSILGLSNSQACPKVKWVHLGYLSVSGDILTRTIISYYYMRSLIGIEALHAKIKDLKII